MSNKKVIRAKAPSNAWQVKVAPIKTVVAVNKNGTKIEVRTGKLPSIAKDAVLFVPTKRSIIRAIHNKRQRLQELNRTLVEAHKV